MSSLFLLANRLFLRVCSQLLLISRLFLLVRRMQLLYMHLLIIVVEMEHAVFGQRVFGDFEVDFGQGVFGLERHFRVTQTFHLYYGYALRNDAEFAGGAIREVDDASASVRTAVGDAHDDLLAVALVGYAQQRAEGIGAVSARQTVMVQALSAACARACGTFRIERGLACLRLCADIGKAYCCKNY